MSVFEIILKYKQAFLLGIATTLELCFITWFIGLSLGLILGIYAQRSRLIKNLLRIFDFMLSGIPVLVLLFWLHYPLQKMFNLVINPFFTTALTLSLINIINISTIVRNNLGEIPIKYLEVAKTCNISKASTFKKIEFPLMFRMSLPSILISQVHIIHLTLFGSLISVEEIFRVCQEINSQVYQPIEVYSALAVFFILISLPLSGLAIILKKRFIKYSLL